MSGSAGPFNAAALNAEQLGVILLKELAKQPSAIDGLKVAAVLDRFKALGAPPQDLKDDLGDTPVLLAMKRRHFDFGERMIDEGWDVTARDKMHFSAGIYARVGGREDIEERMRQSGLRPRALDGERENLLRHVYACAAAGDFDGATARLATRGEEILILEDAMARRASQHMKAVPKDRPKPTN